MNPCARVLRTAAVALSTVLLGQGALAADATCDPESGYLTGPEYLRAVSLDVRGRPPSLDEYELLDESGEIPDEVLEAWLASPEHAERVVRLHRDLLWNNLERSEYLNRSQRLSRTRSGVWYRTVARGTNRVLRGAETGCQDRPARWDEDGELVLEEVGGVLDEGWVWVNPYWDPETPIKVCAFDARDDLLGTDGLSCEAPGRPGSAACGCGPNLEWCMPRNLNALLEDAFIEDVDRRVRTMVLEDRPYTEILEGSRAWVNGPLAFFLKHTAMTGTAGVDKLPYDAEILPDIGYDQVETWVEVDLGPEQSGVFTSPAFLQRFATNRGRANQFANNFLCQPYLPPPGGLPPVEGEPTLDLTARDGCKFCHALLEPHAAHWGRWTEGGSGYLDPVTFPAFSDACEACAEVNPRSCPSECRSYKIRSLGYEEDPYLGWLPAYTFLEERHHHHVEMGPKLLVRHSMATGLLPACVAEKAANNLLGRDLTGADDLWLGDLATTLESSGWSYRELVKAIVTSDNYRRVP